MVPAPNDVGADGYAQVVAHVDGAAHFGVWNALLMVASKARPRGLLVREDGRPHTSESLGRVTRLPEETISAAINRLLEIGLLEICGNKPRRKNNIAAHPSAANPQEVATRSHEAAAEGMEQNIIIKKGDEQRKEQDPRESGRQPYSTVRPATVFLVLRKALMMKQPRIFSTRRRKMS